MSTSKEGPLKRLAKAFGLGKTSGGGSGSYGRCWACDNNRCGSHRDTRCTCCRNGHPV